jgi:hypothetical protein
MMRAEYVQQPKGALKPLGVAAIGQQKKAHDRQR